MKTIRFIFILAILAYAGTGLWGAFAPNPYYHGPKSDHYDGRHFSAPEALPDKSFWDVLKWRMTAQRAQWPDWVDLAQIDMPPQLVDEGGALRVSFVNHSTVLLQTHRLNILTDPIWSDRASPVSFAGPRRVHQPGIAWDNLPKIDLVLISHAHYDHLDIPTIKKLVMRDNPVFVVPLGVDAVILKHAPQARLHVMDWLQSYHFNDVLTVHAEPAQHWAARTPWDRNRTLWAGFVLDLPGGKIYFAGDTGYGTGKVFHDTFARHGKMRLALIPIGAYAPRWFMKGSHVNPAEAVMIHRDVQAAYAVAIHFGTFQLTDEAIDAPVQDLAAALKAAGLDPATFRALRPGAAWLVP